MSCEEGRGKKGSIEWRDKGKFGEGRKFRGERGKEILRRRKEGSLVLREEEKQGLKTSISSIMRLGHIFYPYNNISKYTK